MAIGHPLAGSGFGGGPRAFQPIPRNPAEGGSGYFRRYSNGGSPGYPGQPSPRRVRYTAGPSVPDTEPGGNPTIAPHGMMFERDGRLVKIPTGFFGGATPSEETTLMKFFFFGIIGGSLLGALFGAVLSSRGSRARDGAIGAGLGAATGAFSSLMIGRGAALTKA